MSHRRVIINGLLLLVFLVPLVGCSPAATPTPLTVPQTVTVKETVIVAGTPQIVEKVVTQTPAPVDKSGGVFTWGIPVEPTGFNPILNDSYTELYPIQFDSEPLAWGGENYPSTLTPQLAESWEKSSDGLTWTIHLRKNVKWQDGTPFTADDVIFWGQSLQDPKLPANFFNSRFFTGSDPYTFEKVDDNTVKITTKQPVSNLLNLICVPLIPAHYFKDKNITPADMANDTFNTQANIGTGPFKIVDYKRGEAVTLSRNDDYWRGKAYLDTVVFRIIPDPQALLVAVQNGEVDWALIRPQDVAQLVGNTNVVIHTFKADRLQGLDVNTGKPMLADKRTRQAMMYSLDRQAMINTLQMGYADLADSPFNPIVSAYESLPQYNYDPEKAKQLLAEVGWKPGPDGVLVADTVKGVAKGTKFHIVITNYDASDQTATVVQSYFKAVGIDSEIKVEDFGTWVGENYGKDPKPYDVATAAGAFFGADAGAYGTLYSGGNFANSRMGYFNPDVQALFDKARSAKDQAEADGYYKQAAKILWDELPNIPTYWPKLIFASSKRLHIEDAQVNTSLLSVFTYPEKLWVEK